MALGTNAEMRRLAGPATATVDLGQRTVIPGLVQTHFHTFTQAATRYGPQVALVDSSVKLEMVAENAPEATAMKLRDTIVNAIQVRSIPKEQWITVQLYDSTDVHPGTTRGGLYMGWLNRRQIDGMTADNPVLVTTRLQGMFNGAAVAAIQTIFPDWEESTDLENRPGAEESLSNACRKSRQELRAHKRGLTMDDRERGTVYSILGQCNSSTLELAY